jgi:predicted O-methyltransferase YrrM
VIENLKESILSEDLNNFYANIINLINVNILGKTTDSYDVLKFSNVYAAFESAEYYCKNMNKADNYENDLSLLRHALEIRSAEGLILEFGVASGRTINHISSLVEQKVYGFDVFTGLPETWRTGFVSGVFGREKLPLVNKNVELIVGLFEDTLDEFLKNNHESISLLHVDCDLYAGTRTIFNKLGELIRPGTVIVFDEYFNYPGWSQHEFKAFQEFVELKKVKYRYDSFVSRHQQVCVVIDSIDH